MPGPASGDPSGEQAGASKCRDAHAVIAPRSIAIAADAALGAYLRTLADELARGLAA